MLNEIIKYIEGQRIVSLYDLAIHFKIEESALEKILERLVEKKKIKQRGTIICNSKCVDCIKANCQPSKLIFYESI